MYKPEMEAPWNVPWASPFRVGDLVSIKPDTKAMWKVYQLLPNRSVLLVNILHHHMQAATLNMLEHAMPRYEQQFKRAAEEMYPNDLPVRVLNNPDGSDAREGKRIRRSPPTKDKERMVWVQYDEEDPESIEEVPEDRVVIDWRKVLPSDIIAMMYEERLLSLSDFASLARLNSNYKRVFESPRVWKRVLEREFPGVYRKWLDENGEVIPRVRKMIDAFTPDPEKQDRVYLKRLVEWCFKFKDLDLTKFKDKRKFRKNWKVRQRVARFIQSNNHVFAIVRWQKQKGKLYYLGYNVDPYTALQQISIDERTSMHDDKGFIIDFDADEKGVAVLLNKAGKEPNNRLLMIDTSNPDTITQTITYLPVLTPNKFKGVYTILSRDMVLVQGIVFEELYRGYYTEDQKSVEILIYDRSNMSPITPSVSGIAIDVLPSQQIVGYDVSQGVPVYNFYGPNKRPWKQARLFFKNGATILYIRSRGNEVRPVPYFDEETFRRLWPLFKADELVMRPADFWKVPNMMISNTFLFPLAIWTKTIDRETEKPKYVASTSSPPFVESNNTTLNRLRSVASTPDDLYWFGAVISKRLEEWSKKRAWPFKAKQIEKQLPDFKGLQKVPGLTNIIMSNIKSIDGHLDLIIQPDGSLHVYALQEKAFFPQRFIIEPSSFEIVSERIGASACFECVSKPTMRCQECNTEVCDNHAETHNCLI